MAFSNGFNFLTQKFTKNWKMPYPNAQNIRFWAQGSCKNHFLRSFLWPNFDLNGYGCFALLSQKMFSTSTPKISKKSEKYYFQMLKTFGFWALGSCEINFLRSFLWPSFEHTASLSQKTFSTSTGKNLQKSEKHPFLCSR